MRGRGVDHRAGVVRCANTPDVGGYVIAVMVSILAMDVLLALQLVVARDFSGVPVALLAGLIYVTVFAVPTAPIGVLLVHLCCRRREEQWVHVLAAGLAGVLTGVAVETWLFQERNPLDLLGTALLLGVATATGRAAVIGLRPPVGDDYRPGRPAR